MPKSNKGSRNIYLDYASAASPAEANPGSLHLLGVREKNKLEQARATISGLLGVRAQEVIFTSGATESNNLAILGMVQGVRKIHILTTNIEHPSVLEVFKHLQLSGQAEMSYMPVEKNGILNPKTLKKLLRPNTRLVSVMYANNEIGTIQPIREIAKEIRHHNKKNGGNIFFHTDATQAINYLPIKAEALGVDLMSWSGAKIYGPKGIGVLYVKSGTPIKKIMFGGDQEFGLRPGTENPALAVKLAQALRITESIKEKEIKRLSKLRDYFFSELGKFASPIVNGDMQNRLPNNINFTLPKIPSDLLVLELSAKGIMVSSKSACKNSKKEGSEVLRAIHPDLDLEIGGLRLSLGRQTTKRDLDYTLRILSEVLTKLKKWYH